jgi:pimeloyl-ACP methyl ester carboxylesterase
LLDSKGSDTLALFIHSAETVMSRRLGKTGALLWLVGTAMVGLAMNYGVDKHRVQLSLADGTIVYGTLYTPKPSNEKYPIIVVAHGTALNHASMAPSLSVPLARNGYLTLAVDLRGHGHSGGCLRRSELDTFSLIRHDEVNAAIDYLKQHPSYSQRHIIAFRRDGRTHLRPIERIALVGHSRGGWAVADIGYHREDVDSVVSIGAAPQTCDELRPRNFLILVGGEEELCTEALCASSIARATGGAVQNPSEPFGEFWAGTARRLLRVSGATHLTALADPSITRRVVQWVAASLDIDAGEVSGDALTVIVAGISCATLGWVLWGTWILGITARRFLSVSTCPTQPWRFGRFAILLGLVISLVPFMAFVGDWLELGPVYFASTIVILVGTLGLCTVTCARIARVSREESSVSTKGPSFGKGLIVGGVSLIVALVGLGVPWELSWADLVPSAVRLVVAFLLFALVLPGCFGIAWGFSDIAGRYSDRQGARLAPAIAWLGFAGAVWAGYVFGVARVWPMFFVPAGFVAASFVVPVPLWLLPPYRGMVTARAVCHAGALAWMLGCHLPFVNVTSG